MRLEHLLSGGGASDGVGSWELAVGSYDNCKLETDNWELGPEGFLVLAVETYSGGRVGARGDVLTESRSSVG